MLKKILIKQPSNEYTIRQTYCYAIIFICVTFELYTANSIKVLNNIKIKKITTRRHLELCISGEMEDRRLVKADFSLNHNLFALSFSFEAGMRLCNSPKGSCQLYNQARHKGVGFTISDKPTELTYCNVTATKD